MEEIDYAYSALASLQNEVRGYRDSIVTESDTRLKVIDRVFVEVLGWPLASISTEDFAGSGYLDYNLKIGSSARLVVEAKKDGSAFDLQNREAGYFYKLNGPTFKGVVRSGIDQAINYCGRKNAELACVTNGQEWVIFRGSRLGDGMDTMAGVACVFSSLDDLQSKFSLFYDLLSFQKVSAFAYRAYFQEAEGQPIRPRRKGRTLFDLTRRRVSQQDDLARDIDKVMRAFFRRIGDDPQLLAKCFVVTSESDLADKRLGRISEDVVSFIRSIDSDESRGLTDIIRRVKSSERNEFVLLIGTKGAGKSTFVDRFFRMIMPEDLRGFCHLIRANLSDSPGDEASIVDWLNRHLVAALEGVLFSEGPSYEELQGLFYDEYNRWKKGEFRHLYEADKTRFKIEFGRHVNDVREKRPGEYVRKLFRGAVKNRKILPCVVFDNADHFSISFQERVFQYARSIYENEICLVIMPVTDKTSWQLSKQGAFQSFESEVLYLPTPKPRDVIERRVAFLRDLMNEHQIDGDEPNENSRYLVEKGIYLKVRDFYGFVAALQEVFLNTGASADWIGEFSNHDIRRCLELAVSVMTSHHLGVTELVKAYVAGNSYSIKPYMIKNAIIKERFNVYPVGQHRFVQNVYAITDEVDASPLLGVRILTMLNDARYEDMEGAETFVSKWQIISYFNAMNVPYRTVELWLDAMLKSGLCQAYDPTITTIDFADRIEIAPSGRQHLEWSVGDWAYFEAMLNVTPIMDSNFYEQLRVARSDDFGTEMRDRRSLFLKYLLNEDELFCSVPDHEAYQGQALLADRMKRLV